MAAAKSELPPLIALAADEEIWRKIDLDNDKRAEALNLIAQGHVALPFSRLSLTASATGNSVFRKKSIAGEHWLVPQRFERMIDFFLLRAEKTAVQTAGAEISGLLASPSNCLLTGGPGTGKSFQIAALVELLGAMRADRPLRMTIAAPTGKAAARFAHLKSTDSILLEWSTIHRLLGLSSDFSEPRFHARHPLAVDLLVIDEISMLDLGLFTALIDALPAHARVLLAGDLAQLPAVDGIAIDNCLAFLENSRLVTHVKLTRVHRFTEARALTYRRIAASGLAAIDDSCEGVTLLRLRNGAEGRELLERRAAERFDSETAHAFRQRLAEATDGAACEPELAREIFAWLREQTVLTTRREGPTGSAAINSLIAARVARGTSDRTLMPVISGINNYALGIFNGDTGFITASHGRELAVMEAGRGAVVCVPLTQLTGWQPAYAITVHKSQGSEYGEVWLLYDEGDDARTQGFRMLYTAVTRARNHAHILLLPAIFSGHPGLIP